MPNHPITEKVKKALKMALEDCDNNIALLARRIGIDASYLSKYMSGAVKAVQTDNWKLLCDYIPEIDERPVVCRDVNGNGNAIGNANTVFNGQCADAVDMFRRSALDVVMAADGIDAESKIKIYNLLKELTINLK